MFTRGSKKRRSNRSVQDEDADRGQPCGRCGDQCPGFHMHGWRTAPLPKNYAALFMGRFNLLTERAPLTHVRFVPRLCSAGNSVSV
ncbi:hypothetical protein SKAU_G00113660 [Synaphobranchus kaupii]|uniref:Uncharacterized protein n=1 Tax=Synaphobranchus kaupii TaxID=118154 RepID=A0A9Q1G1Q9_SYNKA|nr:hypothetical protein SKAU_G00113660 [Synaphobranchus kaupii]